MKVSFLILFLATVTNSSAQTSPKALPICDDHAIATPCIVSEIESAPLVADMLFNNAAGFNSIRDKARVGFQVDKIRITLTSEVDNKTDKTKPKFQTQMKYELVLRDCRGTDACLGSFIWTVYEEAQGDGYTSSSHFQDKLVKGSMLP